MLFPLVLTENLHPLKPGNVSIPASSRTVASQFCLKLFVAAMGVCSPCR